MKLFRTPEFKTKRALLPSAIYFRDIRPLRITAQQASLALGAPKRSRTVQRLIYAATIGATKRDGTPWIIIARQGGRGRSTMIDTASLERAYHAMLEGEEPPLLPSEIKARS